MASRCCASGRASLAADYWALAKCEGGWRLELGFATASSTGHALAAALFGPQQAPRPSPITTCAGRYRFACFDGERLVGALFLAPEPVAVSRAWACEQLATQHPGQRARMAVMAGRPGTGLADRGATVCSCFGIGANQIAAAVAGGCTTVGAVGQALQAGTNCGSCRGEILKT